MAPSGEAGQPARASGACSERAAGRGNHGPPPRRPASRPNRAGGAGRGRVREAVGAPCGPCALCRGGGARLPGRAAAPGAPPWPTPRARAARVSGLWVPPRLPFPGERRSVPEGIRKFENEGGKEVEF